MKNILFPTDFSAESENAFNFAVGICDKLKANLILFNSFHIPNYTSDVPIDDDAEDRLMNIAEDELSTLETKALLLSKNIHVKCMVSYGLAVDTIISTAQEKQINLIVMGTKGAEGLKEVLIGSNAATVIEKASCPVLVVPEKAKYNSIDKIVFATDFRDYDFYTLARLVEIAKLFNSEIMIVHVSQVAPTKDYEKDLNEWYKEELKKEAGIEYENISFYNLVGGNVADELEEFIEKNKVSMLALSMRRRNVFTKLFNPSLTKKMAYHSQVPLLAFHELRKSD